MKNSKKISRHIFTLIWIAGLILAFTDIAGAVENNATSVRRCIDGCTVHVTIQIGISGTSADVTTISNALEDCYEGLDCKIPCENPPKQCNVTVDVVVVNWDSIAAGDQSKYHHVTMVNNDGLPSMAVIGTPNGAAGSGTWRRGKTSDEYCHETGHLGGLKDKYCGVNTIAGATWTEPNCAPGTPNPCSCTITPPAQRCTMPCRGYEGDIMAEIPAQVKCSNIIEIVASAGLNSCPTIPCCIELEIPAPWDPYDYEPMTPIDPYLKWSPVSGATSYLLHIFDKNGSILWEGETPTSASEFKLPIGLLNYNSEYSWQVAAKIDDGIEYVVSYWSEIFHFNTSDNIFYVNAHIGSDDFDGLTPVIDGDHGPKMTIQGAVEMPGLGHQIHVAEGEYEAITLFEEKMVDIYGEGPLTTILHGSAPLTSFSMYPSKLHNISLFMYDDLVLINGSGNIYCFNCNFTYDASHFLPPEPDLTNCLGVLNEVIDGRNGVNGPGRFFFNMPECAPFSSSLALYFDPLNTSLTDGSPVDFWEDKTSVKENGVMADQNRMPTYYYSLLNGFNGLDFEPGILWEDGDALESEYNAEVSSGNTNEMAPLAENKTLLIVFSPNNLSDRQVIFKAGETTSGFNIYMDNGMLCFGMYNKIQRKFVKHDMPLVAGELYLAHLEYNASTMQFRALINGQEIFASPIVEFLGLSKDGSDPSGIGASINGTRFHDFNTGDTYSRHFDGRIGEILLYNEFFGPAEYMQIYDYLNDRYGTGWSYPMTPQPKIGNWIVYEECDVEGLSDTPHITPFVPNPFSGKTEFSIFGEKTGKTRIDIFNSLGSFVATIFNGQLELGQNDFEIDGKGLSSGVYFVKITGDTYVISERVVLIK